MNNDTTDYRTYLKPCMNFIAFIKALPKIGIDSLLSFFDKHPADEYADSIPIGLFVDEREHLIDILKTINDGFPSEIDYELEYNPEVETCSGNKSRVLFIKTFGKRISLSDMERGEEFHAKFLESSLLYKHRIKALKDELEAHCQRCGIEFLPSEQHTDDEHPQQCGEHIAKPEVADMTDDDILLRTFFGKHLNDFLKEAQKCKNGTAVALLVNWYINEYDLDKGNKNRGKPLHDALFAKGIIKIGVNGWNKAIE